MNVCWRGCGDGVGWDGVYGMSEGGRCDADQTVCAHFLFPGSWFLMLQLCKFCTIVWFVLFIV